jgi:hypothetical protein
MPMGFGFGAQKLDTTAIKLAPSQFTSVGDGVHCHVKQEFLWNARLGIDPKLGTMQMHVANGAIDDGVLQSCQNRTALDHTISVFSRGLCTIHGIGQTLSRSPPDADYTTKGMHQSLTAERNIGCRTRETNGRRHSS